MEGQAFFEVAKNRAKPFSVITKQLTTTVLGTSFDINAYEKNEVVEVALFAGKVEVKSEAKDKKWTLQPNQQLVYTENGTGKISTFNPDFQAIWRTGELKFSETKMKKVVEVLQKQYPNFSIEFSKNQFLEAPISGTFKTTNSIENILELICFSKDWKLEKIDTNHFKIKE